MSNSDNKWNSDSKGNFPISFDNGKTWYALVGDVLKGPVNTRSDAELLLNADLIK